MNDVTRREVLKLMLATQVVALLPDPAGAAPLGPVKFDWRFVAASPGRIVSLKEAEDIAQVKLIRTWSGPLCRSRVVNHGKEPVRIKEVVLFDLSLPLSLQTRLYGEGFQMLSQTGGTLGQPSNLGNYTDAKHYRLAAPPDSKACYGLMTLAPPDGGYHVLGFTSCRRFMGQFYLHDSSLHVVVDTEGVELKPGQTWELEEFTFRSGADREQLLGQLAERINQHHPP